MAYNCVTSRIYTDLHYTVLGADKSLARPGRKQAAPVKSVMGKEMDWSG